jgi:hypothetical protein
MPFRALTLVGVLSCTPGVALAYPGGTPNYVTDIAPFCASCHSSRSADDLAGVSESRVKAEIADAKHLARIRAAKPDSPYAHLSDAQREALIAGVRGIDAAASVEIIAPGALKPGQVFEVTVNAQGGGGPVVGIALVDAHHRWQARPAASAGWRVVAPPEVTGPDGKPQTRFLDGRLGGLPADVSYVNVYGVEADPTAGKFSKVSVVFRLRAPPEEGTFPLSAVFLYGTEKGAPHGAIEQIQGKRPLGGFGGASGRLLFSDVRKIFVGE